MAASLRMDKPKEKEVDDMGVTAWYDHPMWCAYDEHGTPPLKRGDRVRIREGYECSGQVGYYVGKQVDLEGFVVVDGFKGAGASILAAAIEPYPYSREERIERAIDDFIALTEWTVPLSADDGALLFAILDAGV